MMKIVFLRHGESTWNKENRFTGWTDVGLTERGVKEAKESAKILREKRYVFDVAYTSVLKRAIKTLWIVLEEMNLMWLPVHRSWRLNERHYGALQGLNKAETAAKYGEDQVYKWRRSYEIRPPALKENDERNPASSPVYKNLDKKNLPLTECLKDTVARVVPYWEKTIVPELKEGKKIIISASGNSLRALIKYLDNIPDDEISELNIPTGVPLVYELDENINAIKNYYLLDEEEVQKRIAAVKNQGKAKNQ